MQRWAVHCSSPGRVWRCLRQPGVISRPSSWQFLVCAGGKQGTETVTTCQWNVGTRRHRRPGWHCCSAPDSPEQGTEEQQSEQPRGSVPDFMTGVNWFCYSALGLLFLADLTPLGAAIKGTDNPGAWLALLQWGGFVAPTLWLCRERGYDLAATFRFKWCCSSWWAGAAAAGPALFLATNAAVQLRLGGLDELALGGGAGLGPGWGAGGQPVGALLLLWVLLPAVAEEALFRGFLLTALQQRLGRWDSVAVSGALFALMHLSVEQFFQYSLLGFACGAAAVAADSLLPAAVLHATYNLAAVLLTVSSYRG